MEITSKVFALGNSNAIRIPRILMEVLELQTGDAIVMEVTGRDELIIRKPESSGYPSIRELMAGYDGPRPQEPASAGTVGRERI